MHPSALCFPPKVLVHQYLLVQRSKEVDFEFFKDVISNSQTPEFNGYNTKKAREAGYSLINPTVAMYTPLIDLKPSDPTTMLTAMVEAERLTHETGQKYTILTCDQQLYKVMCDMKWAYLGKFEHFIPRLGGMHLFMSFIGCIGVLMQNTGLVEILESSFSGVKKMLLGKNFPNNIQALRLLVEELLHKKVSEIELSEGLYDIYVG